MLLLLGNMTMPIKYVGNVSIFLFGLYHIDSFRFLGVNVKINKGHV